MNLYGSPKYDRVLQRKPYGPGKNPRYRPGRESEYSKQLKEKQRIRDLYGLSERQFRLLYRQSLRVKGKTGDTLKQLLERRLDNVIFRAGFAMTRLQARQFASHGLFAVDGVRVTRPSYRVRTGEKIVARNRSADAPLFAPILAAHEKIMPPKWLKVDAAHLTTEVLADPAPEDAEQVVDMQQVVEFYSRS